MRSSVSVGEGLNQRTIRLRKITPAAESQAARGHGPQRPLTWRVEQLSCGVTWLGLPTPTAVCARGPILSSVIVGVLIFAAQPRLGRPSDERAQVEDTYGSFNVEGEHLDAEHGTVFSSLPGDASSGVVDRAVGSC
jgi:hypothetical protein